MTEKRSRRDTRSISKDSIAEELKKLKEAFEEKMGGTIKIEEDCKKVLEMLKANPNKKYPLAKGVTDPVSLKVIKRMFDIVPYREGFSLKSLSIMAHCLGYQDWDDFVKKNPIVPRSSPEKNIDLESFDPNQIAEGKEITLGWYPDKYCRLEKGKHPYEFRVIESVGFKKKIDNVFYAPGFYLKEVEGQEYPDILIDSDTGWFDEPDQQDLKNREDYFLL